MALLTKGEVRAAIQQAIDDPSAKRWSAANLDVLTGLVQDTIWQQVLDTWPAALSQTDAVTPGATGIAATSILTKRLYRVQKVVDAVQGIELHPRVHTDALPQPSYFLLGSSIHTDPAVTGANSLEVTYAFLPTKFNNLASDATVLDSWPEGHEMALVYATAAIALTKGDAESMVQLARLADWALESMVTHISRLYPIATNTRTPVLKLSVLLNRVAGEGS